MIFNHGASFVNKNLPPEFTYTGSYQFIDDGNGNWRIKFLTSGIFRVKRLRGALDGIDVFCVGGGGGGTQRRSSLGDYGAGGGGGYTKTVKGVLISKETDYDIVIGEGGTAVYGSASGNNGGDTSAFGVVAAGGKAQKTAGAGADGGSGGGGTYIGDADGYFWHSGGEDGSDGESGRHIKSPGMGQHTSTREFGDPAGQLYSTGGPTTSGEVYTRDPNTGDGGYGGQREATDGGSGIVVIRKKR